MIEYLRDLSVLEFLTKLTIYTINAAIAVIIWEIGKKLFKD